MKDHLENFERDDLKGQKRHLMGNDRGGCAQCWQSCCWELVWGEQAANAPAGGRTERLWWLDAALAELLQGVLLDTSSGSTMMAVCCGCMMPLPFSSLQQHGP